MAALLLLLPLSTRDGSRWGCSESPAQALAGKVDSVDRLKIERVGGLAGFGLPGSHLKSRGDIAVSDLSPADRRAVDDLFEAKAIPAPGMPDAFRYRITRQTPNGPQAIEVPEDHVPMSLRNRVKDELD
jgi:hypothetical protein